MRGGPDGGEFDEYICIATTVCDSLDQSGSVGPGSEGPGLFFDEGVVMNGVSFLINEKINRFFVMFDGNFHDGIAVPLDMAREVMAQHDQGPLELAIELWKLECEERMESGKVDCGGELCDVGR